MPLVIGPPLTQTRVYDEFSAAVDSRVFALFRGHKLTCSGFLCSNARRALKSNAVDREVAKRVLAAYRNRLAEAGIENE